MIENNNPRIDVAQLMALVQDEIERQRGKQVDAEPGKRAGEPVRETNNPYQWPQLVPALEIAQQNSNAGSSLSTMLHYRKSIRWLVRGVGKIVLYLGRVITIPQRDYNNAIIHALQIVLNGIRDLNMGNDEQFHQLHQRIDDHAGSNARAAARVDSRLAELENREREQNHLIGYLKATLIMQERRIGLFLDEARRCLPETFS